MNAGFIDGHVDRLGYWDVMDLNKRTSTGRPMPKHTVWFGNRRADTVRY